MLKEKTPLICSDYLDKLDRVRVHQEKYIKLSKNEAATPPPFFISKSYLIITS